MCESGVFFAKSVGLRGVLNRSRGAVDRIIAFSPSARAKKDARRGTTESAVQCKAQKSRTGALRAKGRMTTQPQAVRRQRRRALVTVVSGRPGVNLPHIFPPSPHPLP